MSQLIHYDHVVAAVEERRLRSLAAYERAQHVLPRRRSRPKPGRLRRRMAALLVQLASRLAGDPVHTVANRT